MSTTPSHRKEQEPAVVVHEPETLAPKTETEKTAAETTTSAPKAAIKEK